MTGRAFAFAACLLAGAGALLGGCQMQPQLVMVNPLTGATVDCGLPDTSGDSADFLVSRACISACQAHGFRPAPGLQADGGGDRTPPACSD